MLVDFFLYALIIWGLATILNKTAFKTTPASLGAAWMLTILVFFINIFTLNAARLYRYDLISERIGTTIQPSNPLDLIMPALFAYMFFVSLKRREKAKHRTPSTMSRKDVRQWAMLMALVREQYAAMRKHVNGQMGIWGKARFPARQEKINKLLSELLQRKVQLHGNYALEALYDDLISIENDKQKWNKATVEEIKFVRDILDGFPHSSRRVELQTAQDANGRKAELTLSQISKQDSASATILVPEEEDYDEDIWVQENEILRAQREAVPKTGRRRAEDKINISERRISDDPGGTVVFIIIILVFPLILVVVKACQ